MGLLAIHGRWWLGCLLITGLLALPARAQPTDAAPSDQSATSEAPPDDIPPGPGKPTELTEQTIYIPYTKLREVFETEGRGVFLPYEKFRELWKAAYEREPKPDDPRPPVAALITETDNEAAVAADVVRVSAKVKLEILGEGWHKVPLRLGDAAITSAQLGGRPARIVPHGNGGGVALLVERKKGDPTELTLELEYAKTFSKTPGRNSVSFQAPQAPVSRWQVQIDEPGVKIDIRPLIAASEVPEAQQRGRSEIQAFVGAADTVQIDWTPRSEGAEGLEALVTVQAEQQAFVEENASRVRATLAYSISRAQLTALSLRVPAEVRVVNVFDPNVRKWTVTDAPADDPRGGQLIEVELFEPASGAQSLVIELEQFHSADSAARQWTVPVVEAVNAGRQQGVVVVSVADGLRAETTNRSGLSQVDAGELPAALQRGQWAFAFRYASIPFELTLAIEKVLPEIAVDWIARATIDPNRLTLQTYTVLSIERAGLFRLEFDLPDGFEVGQVRGHAGDNITAAAVDNFRVTGDAPRKLVVNLSRKAQGRVGLSVPLERRLEHPELLAPLGASARLEFGLPRWSGAAALRVDGRLQVFAPESLRVNPVQVDALRPASPQEATQGAWMALPTPGAVRLVQSFLFGDEPVRLVLDAQRRRPFVSATQLLVARFEPGVVKYEATINFNILYSGLKSLRIDVPADLAPQLRNDTPGVRETVVTPPPEDLDDGYVAWSLSGDTEFLGSIIIKLSSEQPLENLDVGNRVEVKIPHLRPRQVDRAWGQIVLTKSEAVDVQESGTPSGLRPIDPRFDLIDGRTVDDAARAFEFQQDFSLDVTATRYELQEVKSTSIELAVVRAVYTRSREISVQALYRMRSTRQRLPIQLPAGARFDIEPLRVNGRNVALEKGGDEEFFAPLTGIETERPFVLELRYTLVDQPPHFQLPLFPDEPAAQQVYLCVYLPRELALVHADGPWTDEFEWRLRETDWRYGGGMGLTPVAYLSDDDLNRQVTGNTDLTGNFPTDGTRFVFSTMRPDPGTALHARLMQRQTLTWVAVGLVVLLGLVLMPACGRSRVAVVTLAFALWTALAIARPMLAWQAVTGALVLATLLVLLLWLLALFALCRNRATASVKSTPLIQRPEHDDLEKAAPPGGPASQGDDPTPGATTPDDAAPRDDDREENPRHE